MFDRLQRALRSSSGDLKVIRDVNKGGGFSPAGLAEARQDSIALINKTRHHFNTQVQRKGYKPSKFEVAMYNRLGTHVRLIGNMRVGIGK